MLMHSHTTPENSSEESRTRKMIRDSVRKRTLLSTTCQNRRLDLTERALGRDRHAACAAIVPAIMTTSATECTHTSE